MSPPASFSRPDRMVLALGWSAGFWLVPRLPGPRPVSLGSRPAAGRGVSVVIPARNEVEVLGGLLESLAAQTVTPDEIIVVDDQSTDGTGALARAAGVSVVDISHLPDGWTGKTWACHQGSLAAKGALLVFLDADVTLAADALGRLIIELSETGGLISVEPFHRIRRPYERLSAVCNLVSVMGTGAFTAPPRRPSPMAFGPCLILSRHDYEQAGGHAHPEVRGQVTEDIALAGRISINGQPVRLLAGRDVISFRMYPGGIGQLVEGWTKMLGTGARRGRPEVVAAVALWTTASLIAGGAGVVVAGRIGARLARALLTLTGGQGRTGVWRPTGSGGRPGGGRPTGRRGRIGGGSPAGGARRPRLVSGPELVAVGVYGAFGAQCWWMLRRIGRFGVATSVLFPIPLVAFVALFARSARSATLARPVRWRGRSINRR